MTLLERVERSLTALGTTRFGVACSGGGDSVALVHLAAALGHDFVVLHVDHGLRADSAEDAAFVDAMCAGLGVSCDIVSVSVPVKPSREAAAREVRYGALEQRAAALDLDVVATAHTLDDQAETVLLRATRGGSLAGIAPRRGVFVRPLLGVRRHELRTWLAESNITWRDDPSNDDLSIERNWTRNVLIPQLAERRPGVSRVLARLAERTSEDDAALDAVVREVYARAEIDETGVRVRDAAALPRAIVRRLVRVSFRELGADATEADVDAIVEGDRVRSRGVHAWFDGDLAVVRDPVAVPQNLHLTTGVVDAPEWGVRLRVGDGSTDPWRWRTAVPSGDLVIRSRTAGDRVRTKGGTKKVHDVLIDAKIPRALRELVPIACTPDASVAVVGLTTVPDGQEAFLDAEPLDATWSKAAVWQRA